MKKIDLHGHTLATPLDKGCPARGITSYVDCIEILKEADIGVFAVTNHNTFDIDQFKNLVKTRDKIYKKLILIPGIELSEEKVTGSTKKTKGHNQYIVLADPSDVDSFDEVIKEICGETKKVDLKINCINFIKRIKNHVPGAKLIILLDYKSDNKKNGCQTMLIV